jgi:hypothetical protein
MTKIILLGNGFDLAHGLKTKYTDFIENFWEEKKSKIIEEHKKRDVKNPFVYKDEIMGFTIPLFYGKFPPDPNIKGYEWINIFADPSFKAPEHSFEISYNFTILNTFLFKISQAAYLENWVDIEEEYYYRLNDHFKKGQLEAIAKLNSEFLFVQKALEEYLKLQLLKGFNRNSDILSILQSIINPTALDKIDNVLFLNFNYTNTEQTYTNLFSTICQNSIECIHIHGELNNTDNPIIFGYGDEMDENYKLIENENENKLLDNIKSIRYSETNNYRKLLSYIDSGDYDIYIMGLSCGISDRTLLHKLFENKYCKSIKVFYHKKDVHTNNYSDIIRNISRHFIDKERFREIVLPKSDCVPFSYS